MIFWKQKEKTNLRSEEYELLSKRYNIVADEVADMRRQLGVLQSSVNLLRGQFNRKLIGLEKEEEKVTPKEEETNINPTVFLSPNGAAI